MKIKTALFLIFLCQYIYSQHTLEKCIAIAIENNLELQQGQINIQNQEVSYLQSKNNWQPTVSGNASYGYNFGQTIDPFTNSFATQGVASGNFSIRAQMILFNGMQNGNIRKSNRFAYESAQLDYEKSQNDLALNVVNAFMALIATEKQSEIAAKQLVISQQNLERIKILVESKSRPQADLIETQAQLANDEMNLIQAQNAERNARLGLALLMQYHENFEQLQIDYSAMNDTSIEVIQEDINVIYQEALNQLPEVKSLNLQEEQFEHNIKSSRGAYYPTLSLSGSIGTGYSGNNKEFFGSPDTLITPSPYFVSNTFESVSQIGLDFPTRTKGFFPQISDNFNQSIFLTLSIPIYSGQQTRLQVQRSKIALEQIKTRQQQVATSIYNDVSSAYNDAMNAYYTYNASLKNVESSQLAEENARYQLENGVITPISYNEIKNRLFQAEITLLQNEYDYFFKRKLLEFYAGRYQPRKI